LVGPRVSHEIAVAGSPLRQATPRETNGAQILSMAQPRSGRRGSGARAAASQALAGGRGGSGGGSEGAQAAMADMVAIRAGTRGW
jgi:hypothetical protein